MSQSILAEDCYAECHTLALFAAWYHLNLGSAWTVSVCLCLQQTLFLNLRT